MADEIVDRVAFTEKISQYYGQKVDSNRSVWHKKDLEFAIQILSEVESGVTNKTHTHYHYNNLYQLVKIGQSARVCKKRENDSPIIYMIAVEDYYDHLMECK